MRGSQVGCWGNVVSSDGDVITLTVVVTIGLIVLVVLTTGEVFSDVDVVVALGSVSGSDLRVVLATGFVVVVVLATELVLGSVSGSGVEVVV